MFYNFMKSKLEMGTIKVRSSAKGKNGRINIEANGLAAIAALFLSRKEKEELGTLSKYIAMRRVEVSYFNADY